MFKFIHVADVHLDSPLRGLSRYESAPTESIRDACRRAFENLVDLAIEEKVSFVLLAGRGDVRQIISLPSCDLKSEVSFQNQATEIMW